MMASARERIEEILVGLSDAERREARRIIVPIGRPKRTERLEHISARVSVPMAKLLRKLAAERNTSVAQLCTQLIELGLPAMTGQHVHELLEGTERAVSRNGH